jgi:uncharacterized protein YlxW (UPF0749 family)
MRTILLTLLVSAALAAQTPPAQTPPTTTAAFADLRASWIDTQLRIAQRAAQIADLQRQNAVLQTQAQTVQAAMQRDCESRHGTLSDVQIPDGAPGETRPECKLPAPSPPTAK